jgi:hypothetical protein
MRFHLFYSSYKQKYTQLHTYTQSLKQGDHIHIKNNEEVNLVIYNFQNQELYTFSLVHMELYIIYSTKNSNW